MNSVALVARPLDHITGVGRYFQITIEQVVSGQHDSLAIGVTAMSPSKLLQMPKTADQIPNTWLFGFDGATWDGRLSSWKDHAFTGTDLNVGDMVGVLIDCKGT